jgi:hypothetical protein
LHTPVKEEPSQQRVIEYCDIETNTFRLKRSLKGVVVVDESTKERKYLSPFE